MSRSKARLAADWFAKLRINAQTQEVEHADVATVEAEVVAVSDSVSTTVSSQLTSVASDVQTVSSSVTAVANSMTAVADDVTSLSSAVASKLNASAYTAADVLAKVKTVDGSGSGLDADTLDGNHASAFALDGHGHNYAGSSSDGGAANDANSVLFTGYGNGEFTAVQTSGNWQTWTGGWATHLIGNHGDGSNYYNQTIIMPFWGVPHYMRKAGGVDSGPWVFWTSENFTPPAQGSACAVTTLANVAGSRSNNTWYQNTTGKPLIVSIQTTGWNGRVLVGPSTASYTEVSKNSAGGSGAYEQDNHTFVVPNNWYYYYAGGNRNQWVEYS